MNSSILKEITARRTKPVVELWKVAHNICWHPIKDNKFDIMYGSTLVNRRRLRLPLTEISAEWNHIMQCWDYKYGAGWQREGKEPILLNTGLVWY